MPYFTSSDQIHFRPPVPSIDDIPGGAGLWALLGARLFSPPPLSHNLAFILDAGSDFPNEITDVLEKWDTNLIIRRDEGRLTTRGWNSYVEGDRAFRYLTEKKRLEIQDYADAGLDYSKVGSLHLICTPSRLRRVFADLKRECGNKRPVVVFEPVPDGVSVEVREEMMGALGDVDVVSPNEMEFRAFFEDGGDEGVFDEKFMGLIRQVAEGMRRGVGSGREEGRGIVVRCGKRGSFTYSLSEDCGVWHPPYHMSQEKVVDPTGGGNTFLGAVCVALARGENVFEAAVWGNIAASYAVEQIGLPMLEEGSGNTWNGEVVEERLKGYRERFDREVSTRASALDKLQHP